MADRREVDHLHLLTMAGTVLTIVMVVAEDAVEWKPCTVRVVTVDFVAENLY